MFACRRIIGWFTVSLLVASLVINGLADCRCIGHDAGLDQGAGCLPSCAQGERFCTEADPRQVLSLDTSGSTDTCEYCIDVILDLPTRASQ